MGSIDDVTWQVLTLLLTVIGLATSVVLWRRRGPASGVRGVAWSLLPIAALLTGTWRLIWEIGDAVVSWGVRFVFSPIVWMGVSVAGVSLVLFVAAAAMRNRGIGSKPRAVLPGESAGKGPSKETAKLGGKSSGPALGTGEQRPAASSAVDDDMADIEAILKRRGIS